MGGKVRQGNEDTLLRLARAVAGGDGTAYRADAAAYATSRAGRRRGDHLRGGRRVRVVVRVRRKTTWQGIQMMLNQYRRSTE